MCKQNRDIHLGWRITHSFDNITYIHYQRSRNMFTYNLYIFNPCHNTNSHFSSFWRSFRAGIQRRFETKKKKKVEYDNYKPVLTTNFISSHLIQTCTTKNNSSKTKFQIQDIIICNTNFNSFKTLFFFFKILILKILIFSIKNFSNQNPKVRKLYTPFTNFLHSLFQLLSLIENNKDTFVDMITRWGIIQLGINLSLFKEHIATTSTP